MTLQLPHRATYGGYAILRKHSLLLKPQNKNELITTVIWTVLINIFQMYFYLFIAQNVFLDIIMRSTYEKPFYPTVVQINHTQYIEKN